MNKRRQKNKKNISKIKHEGKKALLLAIFEWKKFKGTVVIQRALKRYDEGVVVDGIFGKHTLSMVNDISVQLLHKYITIELAEDRQYKLSTSSMENLKGVHPDIIKVVKRAIKVTKRDFTVFEGMRTQSRQKYLVEVAKVSKTYNSFHLYGLAVDLVPIVNGNMTWDDKYFTDIHEAMEIAMAYEGFTLHNGYDIWGWDHPHWQIKPSASNDYNPRKFYAENKYKGF